MGQTFSINRVPRMLSIVLRTLIVMLGAWMMMIVVAYPSTFTGGDAIVRVPFIAPDFLLEWRHWMWVAPWLAMEVAAAAGPRRNLVWFCGLLLAMAITMIAYPIIEATRPELIHSTLCNEDIESLFTQEREEKIRIFSEATPYRDKGLSFGFIVMWPLLGISTFIRLVVLGYLTRLHQAPPDNEYTFVDAAQIAPDAPSARTVKEIAASHQTAAPNFKFGEADKSLVNHVKALLAKLQYLRTIKGLICLGVVVLIFGWFFCYPQPTEQEALERDLQHMYESRTGPDGHPVATPRAVYAALRAIRYAHLHKVLDNVSVAEAERWFRLDSVPANYRSIVRNENLRAISENVPNRLRPHLGTDYAKFISIGDGRHNVVLLLDLLTNDAPDATTGSLPMHAATRIYTTQYFEYGWDKDLDHRRCYPSLPEFIQTSTSIFR